MMKNLIPRKSTNAALSSPESFRDLWDLWSGRAFDAFDAEWMPRIDVSESHDDIVVRAELPGMKKEEIEVTVHEGVLWLRGEKKAETETKERGRLHAERFYGVFQRAITLPASVDDTKASASYKNGILELVLPKREEAKPRQIQVKE